MLSVRNSGLICAQLALLMFSAMPLSGAVEKPRFIDYPSEVPLFSPRRVDLESHPRARRYRTVLKAAAEQGPNFAGKYAIARWGCGTGCIEWAIINLETGRVEFDQRFLPLVWIVGWEDWPEDFLEFRADSALLIVNGVEDSGPDKVWRCYLKWDGSKFHELARESIPLKRQNAPDKQGF